eukprot:579099-Prorocentrum_minimum.AAC.1
MYKRGYSPGGEDCTGTYVEAVSICAHLSVNHLPNAPSEVRCFWSSVSSPQTTPANGAPGRCARTRCRPVPHPASHSASRSASQPASSSSFTALA